jgi:2-C-methyl-D-erythritol 4-phosphate cytidylyltransferase
VSKRIVLVVAAGGGTRFGGAMPKQYAMLDGEPVILRTLARLRVLEPDAMYVALAPDDREYERAPQRPPDVQVLRCGGQTRGQTVAGALDLLASRHDDGDWIAVHDAARPCVPADALARLLAQVELDEVGGLLAVPVADTLKRGQMFADAPRVEATVARAGLWQAQTPQMFRLGILRRAFEREGATLCTDEAQAVEALGLAPLLVRGSAANVKITFAEDLLLASAILASQERA